MTIMRATESEETQYTLGELLAFYANYRPEAELTQLIKTIGPYAVESLIEVMGGQKIYIPKPIILKQVFIILAVRDTLGKLPEDCDEFKAKVAELARTFKLSRQEIMNVNRENRSVK